MYKRIYEYHCDTLIYKTEVQRVVINVRGITCTNNVKFVETVLIAVFFYVLQHMWGDEQVSNEKINTN